MDKDLKSKTVSALERLITGLGQPKYQAGYIFSAVAAHGVTDISAITTLSKPLRAKLIDEGYYISKLEVADKLTDPDGTVKYVFGLPASPRSLVVPEQSFTAEHAEAAEKNYKKNSANSTVSAVNRIDSVLLFDDDRRTLCVSTQAGCAMGCVFCATGRLGLARNLTAGEIVDQVNVIADSEAGSSLRSVCGSQIADCNDSTDSPPMGSKIRNRITNVVFMGMGEPLANYEATLDAVRILNHSAGRHIGIRHLTISTCGLVEGIERLADEGIQPRLAISLNAPTDAIRAKLMPIAKKYPLNRLFAAVELYQRKTRNRVTFEYCLIKGVNDTGLHAQMLVKRLRGVMCNVNLIEYNPYPGCGFKPSGREAIERFAGVLEDAGFETTIRLKMGQTINAACGQLGAKRMEKSE